MRPQPNPANGRVEVSIEEAYAVAKAALSDLFVENRLLLRRLAQAEMQLRELLPETSANGTAAKEEVPA